MTQPDPAVVANPRHRAWAQLHMLISHWFTSQSRPFSREQLQDRFVLSDSSAMNYLRAAQDCGLIRSIPGAGRLHWYERAET